ncbi:hypothetical protein BCR43DRAFT_481151 [Syncephalastrum racemosum]|uniref:Uncharacterized protein n=1 Tax=Syncephalastrum racemosum TaxID=13706 RepID=A0A1X2HRH7_SYNRA|nr:hypothetical protein BCR43DRAFT_481151 [Syncephalastrum racemosum]
MQSQLNNHALKKWGLVTEMGPRQKKMRQDIYCLVFVRSSGLITIIIAHTIVRE